VAKGQRETKTLFLRVDPELHALIEDQATAARKSVNQFCEDILLQASGEIGMFDDAIEESECES
jgi:predicted HicB family RNase H-like nuclease